MKMKWSAILSFALLLLLGCSKEEFGTTAQNNTSSAESLQQYQQLSCSSFTLIKPKVDILYVVDNSSSTYYVASDIKAAVKETVDTISQQFDYRVVGTSLLPVDDTLPFKNYQVMTNSQDPLSAEAAGNTVIKSSELDFFSTVKSGPEAGLRRVIEFINYHDTNNSGLFRDNAYLIVVLVSNGRDTEVEAVGAFGNLEPYSIQDSDGTLIFKYRLDSLKYIKDTLLQSQQFRFFSVTADDSSCKSGWLSSALSYSKMSKELYEYSGATDSPVNKDHYDLCTGGISSVFTAINSSIQQVVIPHTYKYWPITFTDGDDIDKDKIKVYKSTSNSAPVELTTGWTYKANPNYPGTINTRISPLPEGEPTAAKHLIEFATGSEIVYPDCISVTSTTKTEYFGFVVLPQEPKPDSIVVRINGASIPKSSSNGWSYVGSQLSKNIKLAYPAEGDQWPAVYKTGYMIQLNGSGNYYKSGDSVEVNFIAAPL